jgi:subtilase family serine protease
VSGYSSRRLPTIAVAIALLATPIVLAGTAVADHPSVSLSAPHPVLAQPTIRAEPDAVGSPGGLTPAQVKNIYGLDTSPYAGAGETIAIVDAYDNPNIALDVYMTSALWGLPLCGAGCFTKVDQSGGTNYPAPASSGWNLEIALDVEWAHAIAPSAHILLVEANGDDWPDLLAAEQYAGANARYVSNSWGYPEFPGETADDYAFAEPGVSYFASVDDQPNQTQYPATSPNVVAVGGDEPISGQVVPWPSSGGGCSAYETANPAEASASLSAGCAGMQMTPEVSADASGIQVWDAASGWWGSGGTSFATVLWAAAAADTGQVVTTALIYGGSVPLRPITGGSLLKTGLGDLDGGIPVTLGQFFNMMLAQVGGV